MMNKFDSVILLLLIQMKKHKSIPHEFFRKFKVRKEQSYSDNQSLIEQVKVLKNYVGSEEKQYSSIRAVDRQYFPMQNQYDNEEMVLVPRKKLDNLYEQIKILKKAIKSQKQLFKAEISNLRKNAEKVSQERKLLMRQSEYLKDIERSNSESKFQFRKSGFNYQR